MRLNSVMLIIIVALITSCATANKLNKLSTDMTKQQVIQVMGKPNSTSLQGGAEYMIYNLSETGDEALAGITRRFYVRLVNGYVEGFGKMSDYDKTKDPTIYINTNGKIENAQSSKGSDFDKMYNELNKLKELYDKGILTKQEYEKKKKEILEKY